MDEPEGSVPLFIRRFHGTFRPARRITCGDVFCYHRPPAVLRRLYGRELAWQPARGQGFVVVASLN
ncbi:MULTISPECIES: tRNA-dependent cyclodipeptide synthase [Streptomyces]|uniref:tRNA-dependent cyclodipeptide synthase n=1 Tax=Streptomyces TaxID=1883 RepID=UPI00292CC041|nr:tRNA-dependent cyclodipeptide synthase [Streptomyces sp. NEAU-HV9]